jgi:hypothetical protein
MVPGAFPVHTGAVRRATVLGLLLLVVLGTACFDSGPATRDAALELSSARFAADVGPQRFHLDLEAVLHDDEPHAAERPYLDTPIHLVIDGRVELRRGLLDADLRVDGGRTHDQAHVVQIVEYAYARTGGRWYRIAPLMPTGPVRPAAVAAAVGDLPGLFAEPGTSGADGVGGSLNLAEWHTGSSGASAAATPPTSSSTATPT